MFILLMFLLLLGALPAHAATGAASVDGVLGKIDLAFERNEGQADPNVKYLVRGRGYGFFLTGDEAIMRFTTPKSSVIQMRFLGQSKNAQVEGVDPLESTTNYFLGNGLSQKTGIKSFNKVRYAEIYPGIDAEYHGNGRILEYDFIVKPGSDPNRIRLGFSGVQGISVDSSGNLVLKTDGDPVVQKKPHVYQEVDATRTTIDAAYVVTGSHVEFKIGEYDRTKPLIIDPELIYATYFGGTGTEIAYGIAVDQSGAVYVTGVTASTDFPVVSAIQSANKGGATDAFVFKLNPGATQIVYSTYIGGSGTDEAHSIAVDSGGNAYITGFTQSNDFPIVNGFQKTRAGEQEAYVLKLNSAGTAIVYSTYLGGSSDDRGFAIALDAANNAYVTGTTASTNFPTANPFQRSNAGGFADGFVSKLGASGNLIYSTYIGGIGNDNPLGIAVDGNGAAYVTGWTTSVIFPLVNAFQAKFSGRDQPIGTDDVFVLKLNPAGTNLDYSTYVGGTGSDEGTRIAVDSTGSAYVTGYTASLDFPTAKPYQTLLSNLTGLDAFIFKLSPDGKSLVFSTYFGGFQNESGTGIAVDALGAVYMSGYTTSFDLPTANQTQGFIGGDRDAFIVKFDPTGKVLVFSSFLGASGTESATGLTLDSANNVYVLGFTTGSDFPAVNAVQPATAGGQDIFIAKLNVEDIVSSSIFEVAPQGASSVVTKGTRTDAVFGYAVAEPTVPGTQLTGLAIINRQQNGSTVSQVGIPAPPLLEVGRLFVDVSSTGRSVLTIANPSDQDATVDLFYTDQDGATNQFVTITVKAHEHFSRFVTDDPLLVGAPGTINFTASIPVLATAFFTISNENSELLLSNTPIINPYIHTAQVGNQPITIPELAEGGGWKDDIILVNTSEDRMNGEVRFFSQGSGSQPGAPMEVGVGDESVSQSAVEYDIPPRTFRRISTAGNATISEVPFSILRGTSIATPNSGPFQITGWASADSTNPADRLNGLQIIEYRQLGVTQSQTGLVAPSLRQTGRFFAELTDKIRPFVTINNPIGEEVTVDISLTDDAGTSTDPITLTISPYGQFAAFLSEAPISMPLSTKRTVSFSASQPVFVSALRFFTNERSDSILSVLPITDLTAKNQTVTIPHFADGIGWKTQVVLVNNSDDELRGEVRFLGQGSATDPTQGVVVNTDSGTSSVFEYHLQPRGFFQLQTDGQMPILSTGSIQIVPFLGFNTPAAYDEISQLVVDDTATAAAGETRTDTIFVTSVEGQLPAKSFRLYAESNGDFDAAKPKSTRSSIAIANPSSDPATVQLEVTSFDNARLGISAPITIPPNGQFSAYLLQISGLESLPFSFQGTLRLTVLSGSGVTAAGFRILRNERLENLVTTTGPLNENPGLPGRLVFSYLADSTGYTTRFIVINPDAVNVTSGVLRYWSPEPAPLAVDSLKLGSIQVVPFGGFATPHAHVLLYHRDGGVLTFLTSVEGQLPAKTLRMYAESIGDFDSGIADSTRSGVALANPSDQPATVVFEMRSLNGTLLRRSGSVSVPPTGQVALFLNQVPGFETLAAPFEGVLSVVATSAQGITASGFRAVYNNRGNTLFTTTGPLSENAGTPAQLVFPHIAEGGGYTTQFIVIGGVSGQPNAGVLRFFNQEGNPLNLTLTSR